MTLEGVRPRAKHCLGGTSLSLHLSKKKKAERKASQSAADILEPLKAHNGHLLGKLETHPMQAGVSWSLVVHHVIFVTGRRCEGRYYWVTYSGIPCVWWQV